MQDGRNIQKRLPKVIYLTSMQGVGWWESDQDDLLKSLSVFHCH